jgi:hypothetical protein
MWPLRPLSDPCMDGRELFFLSIDGRQIYGVSLETALALTIEPARVLAEGNFLPSLGPERPYDVSPDGESFVVIRPESGTGPRSPLDTIFVQHWFQELSRLVPVD